MYKIREVYQCSDGTTYSLPDDAERHQHNLAVDTIGEALPANIPDNPIRARLVLADHIACNADRFKAALALLPEPVGAWDE